MTCRSNRREEVAMDIGTEPAIVILDEDRPLAIEKVLITTEAT